MTRNKFLKYSSYFIFVIASGALLWSDSMSKTNFNAQWHNSLMIYATIVLVCSILLIILINQDEQIISVTVATDHIRLTFRRGERMIQKNEISAINFKNGAIGYVTRIWNANLFLTIKTSKQESIVKVVSQSEIKKLSEQFTKLGYVFNDIKPILKLNTQERNDNAFLQKSLLIILLFLMMLFGIFMVLLLKYPHLFLSNY